MLTSDALIQPMAPLGRVGTRTPSQSPCRAFTRNSCGKPKGLGLANVRTGWLSSGERKIGTALPVAAAACAGEDGISTAPQLLTRPASRPPPPLPPPPPPPDDSCTGAGAGGAGGGVGG